MALILQIRKLALPQTNIVDIEREIRAFPLRPRNPVNTEWCRDPPTVSRQQVNAATENRTAREVQQRRSVSFPAGYWRSLPSGGCSR